MFDSIRHRLLLSYLAVLSIILAVAVVGIRVTVVRMLNQQLGDRLQTLANAAALELELDRGDIVVDNEPLVNANQGIQWFDFEGRLVDDQGDYVLTLPFDPDQPMQIQHQPYPIRGLTIPVNDYGKDIFIGYVRVSESTQGLNDTLRSLDIGLVISLSIALSLSALGSLWLTLQAMQPIEQSFHRLQRFTSDAAHELRSPLAAIKTNAAVALKYPEGIRETDAEKFEAIKSAATQLTALTESLLTLARTDRPTQSSPEIIDLAALFKRLIQLYQPQFVASELQLKTQINANLHVKGDRIQLTRLFTNLLDNARRYTPSGGTVEVRIKTDSEFVSISIEDTGVGIAPDHLEHIFERFWQVDQARSYQAGGFGLGLAIAQNIARNHGGAIGVTSEMGNGSCFTVRLPMYIK